jgi:IS4 transposase
MTDSAIPDPPEDVFKPEYPTGETHPAVLRNEQIEPWHIATAGFLADHEFTHDFASGRRYDAPTMMRGFVYQRIVGLSSFHELASHLEGRPKITHLLGFTENVPNSDTFREWWKNRLEERWRDATETIVAEYFRPELADLLLSHGLPAGTSLLDLPDIEQDPQDISDTEKRDAIKNIRPLVFDLLSFRRAENTTFHDNWFLDFQALISRERSYAEQNMDDFHTESEVAPSAPTHFNTIQSRSADEWQEQFEDVFECVVDAAKDAGMLNRPVEVMIDGTDIPFYPQSYDKDGNLIIPEEVVGTKKSKNTTWAYKMITISARTRGRTVKLGSFALKDRGNLNMAAMYLIRRAKELLSIKRLYMDSEFIDVGLLSFLERQNVDFVVQYRKAGKDIKNWVASLDGDAGSKPHIINPNSRSESLRVTMLAKRAAWGEEDDDAEQTALTDFGDGTASDAPELTGKWVVYVTNIEDAGDDPKAWAQVYARRWAIETNYRVIKHDFLAKTTSRKFSVRVFYWLFACLLYDAWVLLDVFLRANHPEKAPDDRPVMPARSFAKAFYSFDPG